ncbi:vWA domain-containing protein [Flagellimonas pelagia]|uniref:VWA domain-containing protein n=1 Tax=Flagellimonas pelagia TaxID=2306998 RepID=A0A3A1NNM3_9FLAO|nr:vWA domain-containing protein [Allomuricauda maritima]RIV45858.1 VWA domain-containing protein [Allomuricauda maritima]TXJ98615.1 VWA domain-containing protein [Allomuricauda maritima]
MELRTVLLIVLAAVAALSLVFYQYFYKNPRKGNLKFILAAMRFLTLFCGLLLLINPKFVNNDYYLEKTNLVLLVDDSSSMEESTSKDNLAAAMEQIRSNPQLNDRFTMHQYAFGSNLEATDSIRFDQNNTDIAKALSTVDQIFLNGTNATILFSDGNQTLGRDYEYLHLNHVTVAPVVVGDTTQYEDLAVGLINVNKYAFLKNKFPVETTILYRGARPVSSTVSIYINGKRVHQEQVNLNATKNSQTLNTLIEAESVGIKTIKVEVGILENERNTSNNFKESAIEVIDEQTNVVIVSDILHPDIGALKKSIEANEQRSVSIVKPNVGAKELEDADILILYQPTRNFREVYTFLQRSGLNYFTITGSKTDWSFLNQAQGSFSKDNNNQTEDILPVLNNAFGIFNLGDFTVDNFPPLIGSLGEISILKESSPLMFQQIRGVDLDKPLFTIITESKQREAALFGENLWRWRAQVYRNDQSFQKFDEFMGNLMVYLGSNNQRSRLELDYSLVFDNAGLAKIRASYFDESYQFDTNARINIKVEEKENQLVREAPMLLKGSYFEVDLSDLASGEYDFTVTVTGENLKRSGSFKILDFNPEEQLSSANYQKLDRLAQKNQGKLYYFDQVDSLIEDLATSTQFLPVQKSRQNVVSLIDFRILLGLMALTLALEWFIRKYNGLI